MDQTITCPCGNEFILTVGEQKFFASKGFEMPRRCKPCRIERKRQREEAEQRTYDR